MHFFNKYRNPRFTIESAQSLLYDLGIKFSRAAQLSHTEKLKRIFA